MKQEGCVSHADNKSREQQNKTMNTVVLMADIRMHESVSVVEPEPPSFDVTTSESSLGVCSCSTNGNDASTIIDGT